MASRLIAAASTKPALTTNLTNGTQDGIANTPSGCGSRRLTHQSAKLTRAKLANVEQCEPALPEARVADVEVEIREQNFG